METMEAGTRERSKLRLHVIGTRFSVENGLVFDCAEGGAACQVTKPEPALLVAQIGGLAC